LVNVATPAVAVAVVVPVSCAPAVPPVSAAVTTVELSVASVLPLLRTWTTGCVVNAVACTEPTGWVATNRVFCGAGGGEGAGEGAGAPPPPPPPPQLANNPSAAIIPPRRTPARIMQPP
jgi:hypothetical protein